MAEKGSKESTISKDGAPSAGPDSTPSSQHINKANVKKSQSFIQSEIIVVYVGLKRKRYSAHKDLLVARSGYFRRLLSNPDWEETKTGEVYWPDDDPEAVETMMEFLYNSKFVVRSSDAITHTIECYQLATTREMEAFKNAIIDGYRVYIMTRDQFCDPYLIRTVRELGMADTKLHEFLFRTMIYHYMHVGEGYNRVSNVSNIKAALKLADAALLADIVEAMMNYTGNRFTDPRKGNGCDWHDHSDGIKCQKRK